LSHQILFETAAEKSFSAADRANPLREAHLRNAKVTEGMSIITSILPTSCSDCIFENVSANRAFQVPAYSLRLEENSMRFGKEILFLHEWLDWCQGLL
jgi:hypothetical protein